MYWQKKSMREDDTSAPHGCWFKIVKKDGDHSIFAMEIGAEGPAVKCARAMSHKLIGT